MYFEGHAHTAEHRRCLITNPRGRNQTCLWALPEVRIHFTVALPAGAMKTNVPIPERWSGSLRQHLTVPCLYSHGIFHQSPGTLVWAGSCLLWYASCLDQEKFIFLAKHQWFCSYCCSCLDTRRLCPCSSEQNSTASLLLLCSRCCCTVFWPSLCLPSEAHLLSAQSCHICTRTGSFHRIWGTS